MADCKASSAETYRSALKHFSVCLAKQKLTPNKFLDLVSADQARPVREKQFVGRKIMKAFREYLEALGLAPKGILTRVGAVQSYGKYYEVVISTKYTQMPVPIVQTKSYPWTKEAFGQFMGLLETPMYQALESCLYQSGLGIGDALALKYKVIQEDYEAKTVPVCLDLVRHKTTVEHRSFLSTESVELLKVYFEERGQMKPEDLLFPIQARSVEGYFALRAQKLLGGYEGRNPAGPHSIRKFFRTSVVNANCPESYAEYWEGHNLKADLRKTYTSMSNAQWSEQYQKYMKALSFEILEFEVKKLGKTEN